MSSTSRAWIAAACIGVVEALKDQGVCRWNSTLRSIQHHTKANLRSYSHAKKIPTSQYLSNNFRNDKLKQSEESLRTVINVIVLQDWVRRNKTSIVMWIIIHMCSKTISNRDNLCEF
ncbi:hypothetical protein F8388_011447 [Cannabis sativa]|uniref:Wound-responsive family protein n=1 Tax=Cannabis sativa TaxID=3483 RepID=A0A7J6G3Y2_CANSA|nr:hypothetical protein F8388_011447 [Cannabis sativa]